MGIFGWLFGPKSTTAADIAFCVGKASVIPGGDELQAAYREAGTIMRRDFHGSMKALRAELERFDEFRPAAAQNIVIWALQSDDLRPQIFRSIRGTFSKGVRTKLVEACGKLLEQNECVLDFLCDIAEGGDTKMGPRAVAVKALAAWLAKQDNRERQVMRVVKVFVVALRPEECAQTRQVAIKALAPFRDLATVQTALVKITAEKNKELVTTARAVLTES